MGQSTDAILCYGIQLDEDEEFPWQTKNDYPHFEDWWFDTVCGYKAPYEVEYTEDIDSAGRCLPGRYTRRKENGDIETKEEEEARWQHERDFKEAHPCPVELVVHCSGEFQMYIIALAGTVTTAHRGYPVEIGPLWSCDRDRQYVETAMRHILTFCKKHNIALSNEDAQWWLCSMWG